MNYTISVAWVLDVDPEAFGDRASDPLHTDVVNHARANAELMRAKYPDREFKCILSDMIVSAPEYELAPRGETERDSGGD